MLFVENLLCIRITQKTCTWHSDLQQSTVTWPQNWVKEIKSLNDRSHNCRSTVSSKTWMIQSKDKVGLAVKLAGQRGNKLELGRHLTSWELFIVYGKDTVEWHPCSIFAMFLLGAVREFAEPQVTQVLRKMEIIVRIHTPRFVVKHK